MTVYSNSRLWLRRNMARMQQMLVMRVVSLLISRWSINLCWWMAYCWMVTLLHHVTMAFEISGEQGGSWIAQDCHWKSRLYWQSKLSTVFKSDLFPTAFNNIEAKIIFLLGCYWNGCCSIWILWKGQNLWFELQRRGSFWLCLLVHSNCNISGFLSLSVDSYRFYLRKECWTGFSALTWICNLDGFEAT